MRSSWLLVGLSVFALGCRGGIGTNNLTEVQRARSGMVDVVLLSQSGALRHGKDTFVIEFRSTSGDRLVDVGTVKGTATMSMAGSPMLGSIDVKKTGTAGRYEATSDLSMAGTWRTTIEWSGPAGEGSVTLSGSVQ